MAANQFFDWGTSTRFARFDTVRANDANDALDLVTQGFTAVAATLPGTTYRGNWATATLYAVSDLVRDPGGTNNIYYTVVGHTSGVLATDIAAGKLRLYIDVSTLSGSSQATEVYEERSSVAPATIVVGDVRKKIKYTGAGNVTLPFDTAANLGSGYKVTVWNGTTGYLSITADGATYRMYPNEIREVIADLVNSRLNTIIRRNFHFKTSTSFSLMIPANLAVGIGYRSTGSAQGGGGGGGGGSGRGVNTQSGSGGSGGSGGAAGQIGQTIVRRLSTNHLPAVASSITVTIGAGGAKGVKGTGGVGATSGNVGNDGTDATSGAAGNPTTFGTTADLYYSTALGGTAGVNKGLKGLAGNNNNAGGAAVTNNASVTAAAINAQYGYITTSNPVGAASVAGTTQTSAAPGTAGGAGGDTAPGFTAPVARSGASLAPGGLIQSGAVPSAGNPPALTPAAETNPGIGGLGGGGGGGSPGVGAGASAATGAGAIGADGADGGPGEFEVWGE